MQRVSVIFEWLLRGYGLELNEMRARGCRGKECRIFFHKCHVVKLWRVLYYFQEERLNFLPLDLFSVSTPLLAVPVALLRFVHWVARQHSGLAVSSHFLSNADGKWLYVCSGPWISGQYVIDLSSCFHFIFNNEFDKDERI